MARWTVEAQKPTRAAARDFAVSLIAGILLFPSHGAEVVCMFSLLAGGLIGFTGLALRRLHIVMIGLAFVIVAAGCQAVTVPDWHRHSLLAGLAWTYVAITAFLDFLAVSAGGVE